MDGVGETGAETLPSLQSSGAGLGGVAYFWGELAQAQARVGPPTTISERPHLAVFSAESGTGRPDVSHPRAAPRKEENSQEREQSAASVVLIVSMPRQKAAVSCG